MDNNIKLVMDNSVKTEERLKVIDVKKYEEEANKLKRLERLCNVLAVLCTIGSGTIAYHLFHQVSINNANWQESYYISAFSLIPAILSFQLAAHNGSRYETLKEIINSSEENKQLRKM